MAILFALLAFVGWGIGDIFGAFSSRKIGGFATLFWFCFFSLIITSLYIPFAGPVASFPLLVMAFALGLIDIIGTLFYFRALEIGTASLVGAIAGSFGLVTVLISVIIFHEKITAIQLVGIILVAIGVVLASLDITKLKQRKLNELLTDKSVKYSLVPLVGWGIYFAFIRIPAESLGWFWSYYPLNLSVFILALAGILKPDFRKDLSDHKNNLYLFLFAIFVIIAMIGYNWGILSGFTSVVAPVASAYPVLFVVLARFIFKDKLSKQQLIGISSALVGIVIIGSGL